MKDYTPTEQALIESYLASNKVTVCKSDYGYNERTDKANTSKQGYGEAMTTAPSPHYVYDEDDSLIGVEWQSYGWSRAIEQAELHNKRNEIRQDPNFQARVSKFTAMLKRKARVKATKCKEKTLKQNGKRFARRELPTPPSKVK